MRQETFAEIELRHARTCDHIRRFFVALGHREAAEWTDDDIEHATARMNADFLYDDHAMEDLDAAMKRFYTAVAGHPPLGH